MVYDADREFEEGLANAAMFGELKFAVRISFDFRQSIFKFSSVPPQNQTMINAFGLMVLEWGQIGHSR